MAWVRDANGEWVWSDAPATERQQQFGATGVPGTQVPAPGVNPGSAVLQERNPRETLFGVDANSSPGGIPHMQGWDPRTQGEALLSETWLPNLAVRGFNSQVDMANGAMDWLNTPIGQSPATNSATQPAAAPTPQLDFTSDMLPEERMVLEALQELQNSTGAIPTITAPRLPSVPEAAFTPDAGLQTLLERATRRQEETQALIEQLRADRGPDMSRGVFGMLDPKWVTLGRALGHWSASNDWGAGGEAMMQALQESDQMRRELRDETLALTELGYSAEDAVTEAMVRLTSDQSRVGRELALANYNRDTQQTGLDFQASTANATNQAHGAGERARAGVTIAQTLAEIAHAQRERGDQAAGLLTTDPMYSDQAFGALAGNLSSDPQTQSVLANRASQQQLTSSLMNVVATAAGTEDQIALRFLRQFDPRLTSRDLRQSSPQQLMMRLSRSPQFASALQANRDYLLQAQQFGAAAPSQ